MAQKLRNNEAYCRKCTKFKVKNAFYPTTTPFLDTNGLSSICKECSNDIYSHHFQIYGDMKQAINATCQDLDTRFSEQALEATQKHVDKMTASGRSVRAVFGIYKSKLGSLTKSNEGMISLRYKDSDIVQSVSKKEKGADIEYSPDDFELTEEIIRYWGQGKSVWEYEFLDREMVKITSSFECDDYSMEMLMRDICFVNLGIERIRQGIDTGDVGKLIKTRSELMNDANMKPVQATGAEANDQVTFGTLIKKWESEKPIPKALDDEMKRYIDTYMVGHLAKMEGLNNEMVKKYEDAISEHTIDLSEVESHEDGY